MAPKTPTFLIVTPSFNSATFIDETILSVVSQKGPFHIRYHVQDGGSTDSTLEKLEAWKARLASGHFPVLCSGIDFTVCSEIDSGMYDAINRGFVHLSLQDGDLMTYINSDDRLLPGALQFASARFAELPELQWLGGRPCEMNEVGEMMRIHEEQVYPTASLRAGLHDGRHMRFVMQEGTFWRGCLWKKSGTFRSDLRQAGDWDLWRRFAHHTSYLTTDMVLACHRRSAKQLTADMGAYYKEVDSVIKQEFADVHQAELDRFRRWCEHSGELGDRRFFGSILQFQVAELHGGKGKWEAQERPYQAALKTSISVTNALTSVMLPAHFETGFSPACTNEIPLNLLSGYRLTTSSDCTLRFDAKRDALHRIFLRCRNFEHGTLLKLIHKTRTVLNVELPVTAHDRDGFVIAEAMLAAGPNVLSLLVSGPNPEKTPTLLIISCEAMSTL